MPIVTPPRRLALPFCYGISTIVVAGADLFPASSIASTSTLFVPFTPYMTLRVRPTVRGYA
jgi:hypothetical protein